MTFRPLARRLALLLVGLGWLALAHPQAQTAPQLEWQHDGVNVTHFECWVDGALGGNLGKPTPVNTTYSALLSACGTLAAGQRQLVIYACSGTYCRASTVIYVVKL
jgi:hypothetical protein